MTRNVKVKLFGIFASLQYQVRVMIIGGSMMVGREMGHIDEW
jgi:hypothetical protein